MTSENMIGKAIIFKLISTLVVATNTLILVLMNKCIDHTRTCRTSKIP